MEIESEGSRERGTEQQKQTSGKDDRAKLTTKETNVAVSFG